MIAKYKVRPGQNIWDVSVLLFGSIEGVFDLLISNPRLNLTVDLTPGTELSYHDEFYTHADIVDSLWDSSIFPANGERHVYPKQTDEPLRFLYSVPAEDIVTKWQASGDGTMKVDWGDNTPMETIELNGNVKFLEHYFDNKSETRVIKVYGDNMSFQVLDISQLKGPLFPIRPLVVDELISKSNSNSLTGLFLMDGVVNVDLSWSHIDSLMPLSNMTQLQRLDLTGAQFDKVAIVDEYLEHLAGADTHGTRLPCAIILTTRPTDRGMAAIDRILQEDAWNESSSWIFNINGTIYTRE